MNKNYTLQLIVFSFLLFTIQTFGQTYKPIAASSDPANPTDIFPIIMGDTTATGERNDNNTIYQLENGKVYITSGRLVNNPEWALQIEALDLENTSSKAILTRIPNASGTYPDIMWPQGNVTLRNLWIISGEKGALEEHDWGKIRISGENTRLIADHCLIEKDRGGFFQIRANGVKAYITNCVFRNGGNRRILQGNGRGFDARNFSMDTVIMRNTIVHNIQDRFFRSQGGSTPHNYIEIDHCTSFNSAGRHGHIQLGRVLKAKITNNLFINPIMLGSSPIYTDEQTQPDNDLHKVITIDTLYNNTTLTISNNNIFWTQDVLNYWASNDTVFVPPVLSQLVLDKLGAAAADAFFQETLTLNNVPGTILPYIQDIYADPTSEDMFDIIVEDAALAGTPFDSGNLFNFSTFDACYPANSQSATADTDGFGIGAVVGCQGLTNVSDVKMKETFALQVYPNPVSTNLTLSFILPETMEVNIAIMDVNGRQLSQLLQADLTKGEHNLEYDITNQLTRGIYFLTLQTAQGFATKKVVIQ